MHLGGSAADLDTILPVAQKRGIPVVEDACQAHLAEWRGRKVGTYGTSGCFSFQASKNLNSGEGGAILTSDDALIETCYRFHNNSRGRRNTGNDFSYRQTGANLRMTEFQAALLMTQMTRLEAQARTRDDNAGHLTGLLKQIPGITPARMYDGCTRNAYHLYMFRYDPAAFSGLSRAAFLKALNAEGVPASSGTPRSTRSHFWKMRSAAADFRRSTRKPAWIGGASRIVSAERAVVLGSHLDGADDAARPAPGHGGHRRGRAESTGPCGVAGAGRKRVGPRPGTCYA